MDCEDRWERATRSMKSHFQPWDDYHFSVHMYMTWFIQSANRCFLNIMVLHTVVCE
jgi:hypothetical protein